MTLSHSTRTFPRLDPLLWRWIGPVPAACMLMTTVGTLYASGVYVAMIDNALFTKAIGVTFLFCEIGITSFAALLHQAESDRMYRRSPPVLGVFCALLLSVQGFMPTALRTNNHILVYVSAISLGLGCGGTYVAGLAVLQAWVPESVGVITGVGMCFISAASLVFVFVLQKTIDLLGGPLNAMTTLSLVQSTAILLFSLLLSCPPRGWHPNWETQSKGMESSITEERHAMEGQNGHKMDEECPLLPTDDGKPEPCDGKQAQKGLSSEVNMSLYEVLTTPSLYPFILLIVAVIGPATGLSMAFPHMMATMFGVSTDVANSWLTWVIAGGIVGRFLGGIAIDTLERHSRDTTGFFASRTICALSLVVQTISLLLMPVAIQQGYARLYTTLSAAVLFSFSAGMVACSCLARSMYTAFNASVTFNMGAFAVGIVETVYAGIIAGTNEKQGALSDVQTHGFDSFIAFSVFLSVAGLLACLLASTCKKAYYKAGMGSLLSS